MSDALKEQLERRLNDKIDIDTYSRLAHECYRLRCLCAEVYSMLPATMWDDIEMAATGGEIT